MLACPGHDLVKLWPLPVEQPWWEDAVEPLMGQLASNVNIRPGYLQIIRSNDPLIIIGSLLVGE